MKRLIQYLEEQAVLVQVLLCQLERKKFFHELKKTEVESNSHSQENGSLI